MSRQNKKKKSVLQTEKSMLAAPLSPTDELKADQQRGEAQLLAEITRRADAVDRVLMQKGEPEYDVTSG